MKRNLTITLSLAGVLVLKPAEPARAQNIYVADYIGNNITEVSSGGVKSIFAPGLSNPYGIAFNSAGNLFVSDDGSGNIYQFTAAGARSTFTSVSYYAHGLAFNSAGNLFVADFFGGNIYEYTPSGVRSTFATGLSGPNRMGL